MPIFFDNSLYFTILFFFSSLGSDQLRGGAWEGEKKNITVTYYHHKDIHSVFTSPKYHELSADSFLQIETVSVIDHRREAEIQLRCLPRFNDSLRFYIKIFT